MCNATCDSAVRVYLPPCNPTPARPMYPVAFAVYMVRSLASTVLSVASMLLFACRCWCGLLKRNDVRFLLSLGGVIAFFVFCANLPDPCSLHSAPTEVLECRKRWTDQVRETLAAL